MTSKVNQAENALEEATCIRKAIEIIAKVKDAGACSFPDFPESNETTKGYKEPSKNETSKCCSVYTGS